MIRPLVIMAFCSLAALAENPGAKGPVVLELFTAEGCSSCIAADRSLEHWAANPNIIVLSEHVDYLDDIGWKDPFSSPLFSTRQLDYATAFHSKDIYAPQVVVNGEKALPGTDARAVELAIGAAMAGPRVPVTLKLVKNAACLRARNCSNVALTVGTLPANAHKSDVLLVITESGLESTVLGGENAGQRLHHAGVVRTIMRIADVDPKKPGEYTAEAHLNLRPEWVRDNLRVVVLVQDCENHRILGAASSPGPR